MTILVAAAVVERDGRILVTKRPAGVHLEGDWEFPGGKCVGGETLEQCLVRELREELDADISVGTELLATSHDYGDRRIELTRTEFLLLELFLRNPRQVLTRNVIFDRVWGYDFGPASNSLEVYIGYLRRKTEGEGESRLIHTVRGVGYSLREE